MSVKLTIGMPVHLDYSGVFMTINALRLYHDLTDCELLVVDQTPNTTSGKEVKALIDQVDNAVARYVPYSDVIGAANAKNEVAKQAQGDFVLLIDCHVMLWKDAIARLKDYFHYHYLDDDLFHGPQIIHRYSEQATATHLDNTWGDGMKGQWSECWIDAEGRYVHAKANGKHTMDVFDIMSGKIIATLDIPFYGHEAVLRSLGWRFAIEDGGAFQIPAQGMGLMAFRRESWLGFNENFRGFGGEEHYLQAKYRRHGRKVWCLPWLRWQHRYFDDNPKRYPRRLDVKFRNALIGAIENEQEIGEVVDHFRKFPQHLSEDTIARIVADPVGYESKPEPNRNPTAIQPEPNRNRADVFRELSAKDGRLNKHAKYLQMLAGRSEIVAEVSDNVESSVYLLAGNPTTMTSFQEDRSPLLDAQASALRDEDHPEKIITWHLNRGKFDKPPHIKPCDLLFIGTATTPEQLAEHFKSNAKKVAKYIAIHHSNAMQEPIEDFLEENAEWFIVHHNGHQEGLTVLSKDHSRKPKYPIHPWGVKCGVGTNIGRLLAILLFRPYKGCGCKDAKKKLNRMGVEWCRDHIKEAVEILRTQHAAMKAAKKTRLPFLPMVARLIVRLGIIMTRIERRFKKC